MVCPICKNTIEENSRACPFCYANLEIYRAHQEQIKTSEPPIPLQPKVKKRSINTIVSLIVIIIGSCILILLLFFQFHKKEDYQEVEETTTTTTVSSTSLNKGLLSSFRYPLSIGQTGLATFVDEENNQTSEVDVLGIRFLGEEELTTYLSSSTQTLRDGFVWKGFEYQVEFYDLDYLGQKKVAPKMDTKVYLPTGCDFVVVEEHNVMLTTQVFGDTKTIGNNERAVMQVLYQIPENTLHSICIGKEKKKMACFTNS